MGFREWLEELLGMLIWCGLMFGFGFYSLKVHRDNPDTFGAEKPEKRIWMTGMPHTPRLLAVLCFILGAFPLLAHVGAGLGISSEYLGALLPALIFVYFYIAKRRS